MSTYIIYSEVIRTFVNVCMENVSTVTSIINTRVCAGSSSNV